MLSYPEYDQEMKAIYENEYSMDPLIYEELP